jgi:hypothetical protein
MEGYLTRRASVKSGMPQRYMSRGKEAPKQRQQTGGGDMGMIRQGNYGLVIQRRTGGQPLVIARRMAADSRSMRDAQPFPCDLAGCYWERSFPRRARA